MDRALNFQRLTNALGTHNRLPSPLEIQDLLLNAEIDLFTGQTRFDNDLLKAGWYLLAIATAISDIQVNDQVGFRRAEAGRVAAHIFDVFLQQESSRLQIDTLARYVVGAQVGYLIGDLAANAMAIRARHPLEGTDLVSNPGLVSLNTASLLLSLDHRRLGQELAGIESQLSSLVSVGYEQISTSPWAAVDATITGITALRDYLLNGESTRLTDARSAFDSAINNPFGEEDEDSRWVAAILSDLGDNFGQSSIWAIVPPGFPQVSRAFVLGEPPIVLLWPPQAEFLRSVPSPVSYTHLTLPTNREV